MSGKKWADASPEERRKVAQEAQDAWAEARAGAYFWEAMTPAQQDESLETVDGALCSPRDYDPVWIQCVRVALRAHGFEVPRGI